MAADEVTSLESRKAMLQLGLEERRAEVEVHRCAPSRLVQRPLPARSRS